MPGNLLEEEELHKNTRDGCWHWASTRVGTGEKDLSSLTLMAEVFVTWRFQHEGVILSVTPFSLMLTSDPARLLCKFPSCAHADGPA